MTVIHVSLMYGTVWKSLRLGSRVAFPSLMREVHRSLLNNCFSFKELQIKTGIRTNAREL